MHISETVEIQCPYCGAFFTADVDLPEVRQEFIEDCPVCCRPVTITVVFDKDGACHAEVHGEDT
ncbi:MAG: CPXCG motif-containing cysteine-rich protein [Chlorobium sp.]|uniref:CPXCG motif-containing cysteine-rich protein n=1 Tax=Chlorobium sp. TaxID=1095 RepID=UPI001D4EC52D|nr:CPXCG motif-containing cysteine-rich protein [Chlorobium sp.]MBN1279209.1 CPXCG motif-containing cysteine-rich protein [Chlorobiaceae bacterium]MCF8215686.1 CPXCG motif-containing cysteine-rich protein [Chlorobium sp.]MCF8270580.1 CPXCG motif-containing cysteine-rich protein [Chlorobium sp.]MCF8286895.1 CPXCG motif-containing cysteine-rich protein [Chlorobium sp.]MCF8290491.1 CPXCG motif-containing cysteine-rich protein [Chlorobium sp.]